MCASHRLPASHSLVTALQFPLQHRTMIFHGVHVGRRVLQLLSLVGVDRQMRVGGAIGEGMRGGIHFVEGMKIGMGIGILSLLCSVPFASSSISDSDQRVGEKKEAGRSRREKAREEEGRRGGKE